MTTIHVNIPDELAQKVFQLTGNAENFVLELIKNKVKDLNLAREYKQASLENKQLIEDFSHIDLEGWGDGY